MSENLAGIVLEALEAQGYQIAHRTKKWSSSHGEAAEVHK